MSRWRFFVVLSYVLVLGAATWLVAEGSDPNKRTAGSAFKLAVPYVTMNSAGPLTDIFVGAEASTQVAHVRDGTDYEVYPSDTIPGDYGTFVVVAGVLYAPDFANHDGTASGSIGTYTPFSMVSQSAVMGSGTAVDPLRVFTVVDVGATGLQLTQLDSYVIGQEFYQTDVQLANSGDAPVNAILYRAFDCYLGGSDSGYGLQSGSSVGCSENPNNSPPGRVEQLVPITPGNNYYEAGYSEVWTAISTHQPFNDTCRCDEDIDNGAGISWSITVPAAGTSNISHQTYFSPTGAVPGGAPIPTLSGVGTAAFIGLMAFLGVVILFWQRS